MLVRQLDKSDYNKLTSFLSSYPDTSMFLRSNIEKGGIEFNGKTYQGEYWGAFDSKQNIAGVLVHYWNKNVMFQSPNIEILNILIEHFKQNASRPIMGILGNNSQALELISKLGLLDLKYNMNCCDHLYKLNLKHLIPYHQNITGDIINTKQISKEILFQWIKDYEVEALNNSTNTPQFNNHIKQRVKRLQTNNNCWVLSIDNTPVSLAGFNATISDMVQIGPLWTPPKNRRKGYGIMLLSSILHNAKDANIKSAILFTDNFAAEKLYQKLGFKRTGDFRIALLEQEVSLS